MIAALELPYKLSSPDERSYVGVVYVSSTGVGCGRFRNESAHFPFREIAQIDTESLAQFQFEAMATLVRYYRRKYSQHRQVIERLKADGADLTRLELIE